MAAINGSVDGQYSGTLKNYDILLKSLLIGDSGVGKSCFLARFVGEHVNNSHIATIGIDFKLHTVDVDGVRCRIQMWDTAGQERFLSVTQQYYRRVHGIFLMYDITNANSFQSIRRWIDHINEHASEDVRVLLVGNKYDMARLRVVSKRDGEELAGYYGIQYVETSALEDVNVKESVQLLCRRLLSQHNSTVAGDGSCLPQAAIDGKIALEDIGKRKESSEQVEPCGC